MAQVAGGFRRETRKLLGAHLPISRVLHKPLPSDLLESRYEIPFRIEKFHLWNRRGLALGNDQVLSLFDANLVQSLAIIHVSHLAVVVEYVAPHYLHLVPACFD